MCRNFSIKLKAKTLTGQHKNFEMITVQGMQFQREGESQNGRQSRLRAEWWREKCQFDRGGLKAHYSAFIQEILEPEWYQLFLKVLRAPGAALQP